MNVRLLLICAILTLVLLPGTSPGQTPPSDQGVVQTGVNTGAVAALVNGEAVT